MQYKLYENKDKNILKYNVGWLLFLWNSDKFHLFIHVSSNLLIFLYYSFFVYGPTFFSRQKHDLDFFSSSVMSNSIALLQEFYFQIFIISYSFHLHPCCHCFISGSHYLVWNVQQPPTFSSHLQSCLLQNHIPHIISEIQFKILPHNSPKVILVAKWFSSA